MSGKTNTTLIGVFVLGAVVLALGAIMALGSGMFLTQKYRSIMFFPNSVSGLEVGAPVLFRGVPIGAVREISLEADFSHMYFFIPVIVEIYGNKISLTAPNGSHDDQARGTKDSPDDILEQLIKKGLRAQLVTQSFVTGQLAVSLDLMPDTPVRLVGGTSLPEIPTVPSTFEKLTETLKRLPLQELVEHLTNAVTGIEKLVNSPAIAGLPEKIGDAVTTGSAMMHALQNNLGPMSQKLEKAVVSFTDLAVNLDKRSSGLSEATQQTLLTLEETLKESRGAIRNIQKIISPTSPTVTDLNRALAEIAAAARGVRELVTYLERHPEALIQGKGGPRK